LTSNHYDWKNGPASIQQHSVAKHRILQAYLAAYFRTLVSSPNQDVLRLTLVDGFAGGGQYIHSDTGVLVDGSPFIFLNATREADLLINANRRKPIRLEVDYFFVESGIQAYRHLQKVLSEQGHSQQVGKSIHLLNSKFTDAAADITTFIKQKSPINGRSIFALDQYGYKDVPTALIRQIFAKLPSAEIILTFGVDSFLNYASDSALTRSLLEGMGLDDLLGGRNIEEIKRSDKDWRLFIQSHLYKNLVAKTGAKHYTPFFIRNKSGHGDYWLIHLSQHHRARDVMTEVHWENSNHFIHYGGAGLDMFQMVGYDPNRDSAFKGQSELGFEFDNVARDASVELLTEQIPQRVFANDVGISFGELFATTCNGSPASAAIYRSAIEILLEGKIVEVIGADGVKRRSAQQIRATDQIMPPAQRSLFG
jgi:three-Cys-motif partner protein